MKILVFCLVIVFAALPAKSDSYLNEMKIGIYAKDFKKIYENLDLYLSGDINNTNPHKWIEVGDMLVEIKDYSAAWQFYLHSAISLFQNETFSKREKSEIFGTIIDKSENLLKNAGPMDNFLIQKNKYSIYPGKSNVFNLLAIMLRDSEKNVLAGTTAPKPNEVQAAILGEESNRLLSTEIKIEIAEPEYDLAPTYDYTELMSVLRYPKRAYQEKIEGTVKLNILIDEKGNVADKKVIESAHTIFNEYALDAVERISFQPAKRNGIPYMCRIIIPIHFKID